MMDCLMDGGMGELLGVIQSLMLITDASSFRYMIKMLPRLVVRI